MEKHGIINNSQYGYRQKHSTQDASIEILKDILEANENKKIL